MSGVEMPRADQGRGGAKGLLIVAPVNDHEDGLDKKEGGRKDDLDDQDGNASGTTADRRNPGCGGCGRCVAAEVATRGTVRRVERGRCSRAAD